MVVCGYLCVCFMFRLCVVMRGRAWLCPVVCYSVVVVGVMFVAGIVCGCVWLCVVMLLVLCVVGCGCLRLLELWVVPFDFGNVFGGDEDGDHLQKQEWIATKIMIATKNGHREQMRTLENKCALGKV